MIISDYRDDFAKYSGKINAVKIRAVFDQVSIQLSREYKDVRKFIFKNVLRKNSNYLHLEEPIEWLVQVGLVHKVLICNQAQFPLISYSKSNRFNLFVHDVGLLGAMEISLRRYY